MPRKHPTTISLVSICLVVGALIIFLWMNQPAFAANPIPQGVGKPGVSNEVCLACHGIPGQVYTLPNGDILDLYINPEGYQASVHGESGYACIQCHTDIREYPHPESNLQSAREVTLQFNASCQICHAWVFEKQANSVHARAMLDGKDQAATCVDCHGAHNTRRYFDPDTGTELPSARLSIPKTCEKCHSAIYEKYRSSVHGAALTDDNNLDVPTCVDCHGVHDIQDPTSAEFRLASPSMCAKCHTDEVKMARYGLSTYVLSSYVADFHGTTVTLFEEQSPDAETNKAVCYDCHGIHDIQRTKDPETGIQLQENLLVRCQECHPDASANFPSAWLSHYQPSPEKYPVVYYVNLFYKFFIPGTLGGMGFLVFLDLGRRIYDRSKIRKSPPVPIPTISDTQPVETNAAPMAPNEVIETSEEPIPEENVIPEIQSEHQGDAPQQVEPSEILEVSESTSGEQALESSTSEDYDMDQEAEDE